MLQSAIVKQRPKHVQPQFPAADMLMAVEARTALCLSVIAMPYPHVFQSHRSLQMLQRKPAPVFTDDVVSRNVRVTSIDAGAYRHGPAQKVQELRYLLESPAQRILRARRIFDQDRQTTLGEIEPVTRLCD